ncbi:MAG: ATP phosphoribosyltransferase regulatory subunit [Hyphomicrobiaceae bacterium]
MRASPDPAAEARALDRLTGVACRILESRGFERVEPAILQPAELYLEQLGEDLRNRTYVFSDPDGEELCLRPDLTLPTCRLYLDQHPEADQPARLSYHGPAFRYQTDADDPHRPREFHQIGLESFGADDAIGAEVEVLSTVDTCLASLGAGGTVIRLGDLGIVRGLIMSIDMPARWRRRLLRAFERPEAFRRLLQQLCTGAAPLPSAVPERLLDRLIADDPARSEERVQEYLDAEGITPVGLRSVGELTESLLALVEDRRAARLPGEVAGLIDSLVAIDVPATDAVTRMRTVLGSRRVELEGPLGAFERRLDDLERAGLSLRRMRFSAGFGRSFAYYTGFVFQFEVEGKGQLGHLAGGGRYDDLLEAAGAPRPVPAVGAAMHSERLLAMVGERLR